MLTKKQIQAARRVAEVEHAKYHNIGNHEGQRIYETILAALDLAEKRQWRPLIGWEGYYIVSFEGIIKKVSGETVGSWLKNGYEFVRLANPRRIIRVHRAVAEAFIPNPDNKPNVNHIDCDPKNNNADNLEWCTQAENISHSRALGRYPDNYWTGKRGVNAKLCDEQVLEIRFLRKNGKTQKAIASEVGTSRWIVQRVLSGKSYCDVMPLPEPPN
jgi:hypothetical protein